MIHLTGVSGVRKDPVQQALREGLPPRVWPAFASRVGPDPGGLAAWRNLLPALSQ